MTVEALMTQTVTLRKPSGESQDSIGEVTTTYGETETVMYLEPVSGQEIMANRDTPIGDWLGIGRADVAFDAWDQIVYGARTFNIVAPPRPFLNGRTGIVSQVELDLQEIDQAPATVPTVDVSEFDDAFDQEAFN